MAAQFLNKYGGYEKDTAGRSFRNKSPPQRGTVHTLAENRGRALFICRVLFRFPRPFVVQKPGIRTYSRKGRTLNGCARFRLRCYCDAFTMLRPCGNVTARRKPVHRWLLARRIYEHDHTCGLCWHVSQNNCGSIFGKGFDLTEFDDREGFYAACRALHANEQDPEFMFRDREDIPDRFASESSVNWAFIDGFKRAEERAGRLASRRLIVLPEAGHNPRPARESCIVDDLFNDITPAAPNAAAFSISGVYSGAATPPAFSGLFYACCSGALLHESDAIGKPLLCAAFYSLPQIC